MKTSLFACFLAFTCSCAATDWPNWVSQPLKSDDYITAVGIADNRTAAKQAALADIVTQLSVDVNTQQLQLLIKTEAKASGYFEQITTVKSLPMTLTGIKELNFSQQDRKFALQIGVKKTDIVSALTSDLLVLSRLSPPNENIEQRFIWALQNTEVLSQASKKLAIVEHLSGPAVSTRSTLEYLLTQQSEALAAIACEVIGATTDHEIISALNSALPHSGSTQLWMRPQLRWQYAKKNNHHSAKGFLTLALTQNSNPFKVLLKHNIIAQGRALTREKAKQDVIKN